MAESDSRSALSREDRQLRTRLRYAMALVAVAVIVVVTHQAFVLMNYPQEGWHSLTHVALIVIAASLMAGAWIVWSSYLQLHHDQRRVLEAYAHAEEVSAKTGEALGNTERLFESLFDAITDRILIVDGNNTIIKANKGAGPWAGGDPTGCKFDQVFPNCDSHGERRNELALIEYTRATHQSHRERFLRGGVDCEMLLSVDTYPVELAGAKSALVIAIARDVTEQTEWDLVSRHREKMAGLGFLVAGFAHDLGNPLASLSSELELLRDEEDPENVRESLDKVNSYVERVKRRLHEIAGLAHRSATDSLNANVREAIGHAVDLTRYDPRARRIRFNVNVAHDLAPVRMHEDDLVLALINLIVNAFDAMPHGGTLSLDATRISQDEALLTVTDTGVGMDPATLEQAARPLFTTKIHASGNGAGLGLTMVKRLTEDAGGEFMLKSERGRGTRVTLQLPIAENGNGPQGGSVCEPESSGG